MGWTLHPASEFMCFAPDWDALSAAGGDVPFLSSAFVAPLLREFGTGYELLAVHESGHKIDVMALVVSSGRGAWQTFQPSQLPLGAWVMRRVADPGKLLEALLRKLPGFTLNFGITQIDPRLLERPADGASVRTLDYIQTAWIEIEGTFDAYWESRGKNLRQNVAKQRRRLEADGIVPRLDVLTEPAKMADALRDYGALESTGWKAGGGTAIHPDNAQGRFYLAMLQAFCTRGRGRIYRYRFGDKVVAMDLCVENDDTQVVLKTTYDETYRTVSPAFLMRQEALRGLWAEGRIRRVEFYGKLMEWHTRWTDKARALYHLNYYRWGFLPQLHAWVGERRRVTATRGLSTTTNAKQ
jgi:CelD/BcsL family acetyltransferase involved in cellulose biosynthesis